MDPLSITASVGGVVTLGYQISTGLFTLVTTLRDAPKDLEVIRDDTYILCSMLDQIKLFSEPQAASSTDQKFHLKPTQVGMAVQSCDNIFKRIESALQETSKIINGKDTLKGKVKLSVLERSKWPFKKGQLRDLRREIMHAKLTLNLGLSIAQIVKTNPAPNNGAPEEAVALKAAIASLHQSLALDFKTDSAKSPAAQPATVNPEIETKGIPSDCESSDSSSSATIDSFRRNVNRGLAKARIEIQNMPAARVQDSDANVTMSHIKVNSATAPQNHHNQDDQQLEAWTTSPQAQMSWDRPNHEGTSPGIDCRIAPVAISQSEIRRILKEKNPSGTTSTSAFQALRKCNMEQRGWISDHVYTIGAELLHVEPDWEARLTPSVFGDVLLTSLFWITRRVALPAGDAQKWIVPVRGRTDGWAKGYQQSIERLAYPAPRQLSSYRLHDREGHGGVTIRDSAELPSYRAAPGSGPRSRRSSPPGLQGRRYAVYTEPQADHADMDQEEHSGAEEETAPEIGGDVDDIVFKLIAEWVDFDDTNQEDAGQDMSTDEEA
ncbi:hypothetical protein B0T22DRAFT_483232 [Podospora appendiculata]|uniref:Fungal N-terminal domain-containing protein n=1 Tax=Podospora appendiculata TaxID=314037 RepID=A0AAE1C8Q1_9PEZI|nr:hypothetical protein B0T22DRAFT_483232 [Podospora appendiculata]